MTPDERHERGMQLFEEVNGFPAPEPPYNPLTQYTVDHVFGEIWARPGLTRKERRFIAISCVASASAPEALQFHVTSALQTGDITIDEMREFVAQFAVYQGYPRATTFVRTVEEAWGKLQQSAR